MQQFYIWAALSGTLGGTIGLGYVLGRRHQRWIEARRRIRERLHAS